VPQPPQIDYESFRVDQPRQPAWERALTILGWCLGIAVSLALLLGFLVGLYLYVTNGEG
jgi:hypothetical protein